MCHAHRLRRELTVGAGVGVGAGLASIALAAQAWAHSNNEALPAHPFNRENDHCPISYFKDRSLFENYFEMTQRRCQRIVLLVSDYVPLQLLPKLPPLCHLHN